MRRRPISLAGRHCQCGAVAEKGSKSCRKCRRRAQWIRRKGNSAGHDTGATRECEGSWQS
jgi:hypothetical protein